MRKGIVLSTSFFQSHNAGKRKESVSKIQPPCIGNPATYLGAHVVFKTITCTLWHSFFFTSNRQSASALFFISTQLCLKRATHPPKLANRVSHATFLRYARTLRNAACSNREMLHVFRLQICPATVATNGCTRERVVLITCPYVITYT